MLSLIFFQSNLLSQLYLIYIIRVGDEALVAIGEGCPFLRHLNVSGCHQIGDNGIIAIARGCPQLSYLDVSVLQVTFVITFIPFRCNKLKLMTNYCVWTEFT